MYTSAVRALVLLSLVACAPPPGVVHGEKTRVHPVADLAPVWQIDEPLDGVFADGDSLIGLIKTSNARSLRTIDQRDGYASAELRSAELDSAYQPVMDSSLLAFLSLRTKALTVVERPRDGDEHVAVRWQQPLGADPI